MLETQDTVKYAVKVNGAIVTKGFPTPGLAAYAIQNLAEDQQMLAEVVSVTEDGKEILLG